MSEATGRREANAIALFAKSIDKLLITHKKLIYQKHGVFYPIRTLYDPRAKFSL